MTLFSLTLSSQACFHLLCPCSVETTTGRQKQNHGLLLRNQGSQQDSQCRIWALISGKAWLSGLFCFGNSCSRTGRGPRVTVSPGLDTANTSAQSGPRSRQCQHPLSGRRIKVQEVPPQAQQKPAQQIFAVAMEVPRQKILHKPLRKQWILFLLWNSAALVKVHLLKKQMGVAGTAQGDEDGCRGAHRAEFDACRRERAGRSQVVRPPQARHGSCGTFSHVHAYQAGGVVSTPPAPLL